jgi:GxxExxY protein
MEKDELTYAVIGCAMQVHNQIGCGFQEVIYQRSLAIELNKVKLNFVREQEQVIFYDGIEVGMRRADFIVENKIVVELKAIHDLEALHLIQAKNYLSAYQFEKGLLINFGAKNLQYKLIFNNNGKYKLPKI